MCIYIYSDRDSEIQVIYTVTSQISCDIYHPQSSWSLDALHVAQLRSFAAQSTAVRPPGHQRAVLGDAQRMGSMGL
jgi:hypothetical protein